MALFPAFRGISTKEEDNSVKAETEWLSNQSFRSDDALALHHIVLEKAKEAEEEEPSVSDKSYGRISEPESEDENISGRHRKRKKKDKKKKHKKHKRKAGERSDSDDSHSDTVYPSDLLKKEKEAQRQESPVEVVRQGRFRWLDDLESAADGFFCVDRKADPANWQYKSLYRGDVARYKRKGSSSLGLDARSQAVSWDEPAGQEKKRAAPRRTERYYSSQARQLLRSDALPSRPPAPGGSAEEPGGTSFIPLPSLSAEQEASATAKGSCSWVNPLGVYDAGTALWLEGKGQAPAPHQEKGGEERKSADTPEARLTARVEELNRRVRENPTDTEGWLEFIRFQDEFAASGAGLGGGGGGGGGGEADAAEHRRVSTRAVLEKKLAVCERAVQSNPGCVALQLARLSVCRELWEPAALLKEWKKLVFLHPNSASLWRRYLRFCQGHFGSFAVTKASAAYGKCLTTLAACDDGSMLSHPALPGAEEDMLDIFLQQCHFLRQAGHSEKAVCLFQGLLDFTFFKPDSVKELPTRQQVEFFEPFWDSGEPRVGEKGARGWKAWMLQQERGGWLVPSEADEDDDDEGDDEEVKDKTLPKWRIWLDVETTREANHWLPWRPDKSTGQSEEDCEDPERQVLFDDIGPSMIRVTRPNLQLHLLASFLHFLGLPVLSSTSSSSQLRSLLLDDLSLLQDQRDPERPLTSIHLQSSSSSSSLSGVSPVGHMTVLGTPHKQAGLCKPGEEFVQNVLQQVAPLLPAEDRAVLHLSWLQYERLKVLRCVRSGNKKRLRGQGKRSKRLAKRLLKEPENRGRLGLWREYAHLEWLLGNLEEARKVFDTALGMGVARGLKDTALCHLCLLYAQLEVEETWRAEGQSAAGTAPASSAAVHILTKLAEEATYTPFSGQVAPVAILKARKSYEQAVEVCLAGLEAGRSKKAQHVAGLVGCYALFQYLTVGMDAANMVYRQARERLGQHASTTQQNTSVDSSSANANSSSGKATSISVTGECEALAVQQAALLRHHTSTSVFPLVHLREALTSALTHFSTSAPLWHLYVQAEARYHSAGRARRFIHSVIKSDQSVVPYLFAVWAEQGRKELLDSVQRSGGIGDTLPTIPENGLSNRIRSLFEAATATEEGAQCPLLWRMYLKFMASEGNKERAKGIFYKALQNIPWAKGLYMDAVLLFPDAVTEFLDLMTEKELRLRAPMEEVEILLED
ncbi:nuclear exosome regulator NRDE2 isoform X1 [Alosa sapidissima]|uniref:nuclear exosome regulator NRDE2 isoform X1 n=1 Tax=Alosa sapidissima TaxID=34773 RepID=UPI001C09254B|nr:nuclear exosome regulator NRDE2 isoform X1 [Alosa sapidissima]